MVRQLIITIPSDHKNAPKIIEGLTKHPCVHHVSIYHGESPKKLSPVSMLTCKVVNKKTDELLEWCSYWGIGTTLGTIDVLALTSTKPRITTFRGVKPKGKRFEYSDRMSYDEMVEMVDSQLHLTFDYLALIVVGSIICALGLLTNSPVNVVASMLVSPLMGPIVGMTFGTIVRNQKMFWTSFRNELLGLLLCWGAGAVMGILVGFFYAEDDINGPKYSNTEMGSRGQPTALLWGSGVAFASGFGVALGTTSYQISALIGVAISAALLPPIVNSGVCLGASLIMFLRPSVPNDQILHTWIKVGIYSLLLFLINWIILFATALIMFMLKKLHLSHPRTKKSQNRAKFNDMILKSETMDNGNINVSAGLLPAPNSSSTGFVSVRGTASSVFDTPNSLKQSKSQIVPKHNKYSATPKIDPNPATLKFHNEMNQSKSEKITKNINNNNNNNNFNNNNNESKSENDLKKFELTPATLSIMKEPKNYGSVFDKNAKNMETIKEPLLKKNSKTWTKEEMDKVGALKPRASSVDV